MTRQVLAAALLFVLATADAANAQVVRPWYWGPGVHVNPWGVTPGWPYGYGYGATSAYGDALRGQAAVLRGLGEYNRATTEAMINYEQARAQYIENRKRWIETYHQTQRMGRAARQEYYARKREARQPYLEAQRAEAAARARPAGTIAYNGEIQWPSALQQEPFDEQRRELEQLLTLQSQTGSTPVYAEQIYRLVEQMQNQLKDQILAMPANDYLAARKFLDDIAVRARTEML